MLAVVGASGWGGCQLETKPELSGAQRMSAPVIATRTATDMPTDPLFGMRADQNAAGTPAQTGGLQCGGVYCPFAPAPIVPCCTTEADVGRGAARGVGQCGLDMSATTDVSYGTACWQRDQLGVVDDKCQAVPLSSGGEQPGCCTDQGRCGSLDTGSGLGCHYALDGAPADCGEEDIVKAVDCEPRGVFGARARVDVSWGGRSGGLVGLTDDGRAQIEIYLRITVDSLEANNEMVGQVTPCGVVLPPFYSTTLCESYDPIFPDAMWDSPTMPSFPLLGAYQCLNPGCALTLSAQTTLLGVELDNPEAPWPTAQETPTMTCASGMGVDCFPDHDDDMLPGLSIELLTTGNAPPGGVGCNDMYKFNGAPLSANLAAIFGGTKRTDHVLLGVRTKLGGTGHIAGDCNSTVGAGIAEFVQSRAWGCLVQPGTSNFPDPPAGTGESCTPAEAAFMDENLPIYRVLAVGERPDPALKVSDTSASLGPLMSMVRLGAPGQDVACAAVRNAAYP